MELILLWMFVIIQAGFVKFNSNQYILFGLIMFIVTYIYNNKITPTTMSVKNAILLCIIPNTAFWYLAYHCNDFLWVYPYNWHFFIAVFLIYSYVLMYILFDC